MKQFVGIRFSQYGQTRTGVYEQEPEAPLAIGQGVVTIGENGLSFGRIVWQSSHFSGAYTNKTAAGTAETHEEQDTDASTEKNRSVRQKNPKNEDKLDEFSHDKDEILSVRPATSAELISAAANDELSREAYVFCRDCIKTRELDMKLVDVEVLLDRTKIIFYFTAPTRIDFRELVKDLVRQYRTRIELRQIGVRHETQMLGALGNCGMVVCCRRYLKDFAPVTIKMAKEQNLFLNPAKISGICGRLLCCLSYEQDNYDAFHRSCPKLGKRYQTSRGFLRVLRSNMFRNSIVVLPEEGPEEEITLDEWTELNPHRSEPPAAPGTPKEHVPYDFVVVSASPETLDELMDDEEKVKKERKSRPVEKNKKRSSFSPEQTDSPSASIEKASGQAEKASAESEKTSAESEKTSAEREKASAESEKASGQA